HISEKLAEFIFEELPAAEMEEARRHLSGCADCREHVARFQQTLATLRTAPDLEPPRNVGFEFEKPAAARIWRWLPAGVALAAVLLWTMAAPGLVTIQWRDSQLTIAFGQIMPPPDTGQAALAAEIQRLQGHVAYLENRQQRVERDSLATASEIQLL